MLNQNIADLIINYELQHNLTDNTLAFKSHISVEKIHQLKTTGNTNISDDDMNRILQYIEKN